MPLSNPPIVPPASLLPAGALFESVTRNQSLAQTAALTGRLHLTCIWLPAGTSVTSVTFRASTTALAGPSHGWGALYTPALALMAQSTDDPAVTWAAGAFKTFTLSAPAVAPTSDWHYIGFCLTATTMPTVICTRPDSTGGIAAATPAVGGLAPTTLDATAPGTTTIGTGFVPYGYVS